MFCVTFNISFSFLELSIISCFYHFCFIRFFFLFQVISLQFLFFFFFFLGSFLIFHLFLHFLSSNCSLFPFTSSFWTHFFLLFHLFFIFFLLSSIFIPFLWLLSSHFFSVFYLLFSFFNFTTILFSFHTSYFFSFFTLFLLFVYFLFFFLFKVFTHFLFSSPFSSLLQMLSSFFFIPFLPIFSSFSSLFFTIFLLFLFIYSYSIVSTHTLTSKFSSPCTNTFVTETSIPITTGITDTFIFHSFFQFSCKGFVLITFFDFFQFYFVVCRNGNVHDLANSLFLLSITRPGPLVEFKWSVCISKSQRCLCISFSRWFWFGKYHFFLLSNLNFLHNSQWIISPPIRV